MDIDQICSCTGGFRLCERSRGTHKIDRISKRLGKISNAFSGLMAAVVVFDAGQWTQIGVSLPSASASDGDHPERLKRGRW